MRKKITDRINSIFFIIASLFFLYSCFNNVYAAGKSFSDNFDDVSSMDNWSRVDDPDRTPCLANWNVNDGKMKIRIVQPDCTTNLMLKDSAWNSIGNNYVIEMDMMFIDGVDHNLAYRFTPSSPQNNWYGVHFQSPGDVVMERLPQGQYITRVGGSYPNGNTYHIKLEVKDKEHKLYINDQLKVDYQANSDIFPIGRFALRAGTGAINVSETWFDNFKVTSLDNGTVLSVPYFSQNDNPWGPTEYDHSSRLLNTPTIDRWGCAMTSAAMVLRYHGITNFGSEYENKNIDPQTLNEWLKNKGGYLYGVGSKGPYAILDWNKISELSGILEDIGKAPYALEHTRSDGAQQDNLIKDFILNKKNPVILGVTNSQTDGHFIVATGIEDTTWDINDPEWNYPTLASFNNSYYQADYYSPSHTDLSYIVGVINPDVHMLFVDPNGKKTGKIFEKNQWVDYNEIPNAVYDFERPISNPDSNGRKEELGTGVNEFLLPKPLEGNYKIIISSSDPNSLYTLNTDLFQKDATDSAQKITGYVGGINQDIFIINFTPNSASQVVKQVTYTSALTDLEELWNAKQISKKSVYVVLKEELEVAQKASKKKNGNAAEKVTLLLAKRTVEESKKQFTIEGYKIMKYDIEYLIKNL